MPPNEAKKEAFDAVTLRYGISKGRLQNIISVYRTLPNVNRAAFRCNASSLIAELRLANEGHQANIDRNTQLISLLEECCDETSF